VEVLVVDAVAAAGLAAYFMALSRNLASAQTPLLLVVGEREGPWALLVTLDRTRLFTVRLRLAVVGVVMEPHQQGLAALVVVDRVLVDQRGVPNLVQVEPRVRGILAVMVGIRRLQIAVVAAVARHLPEEAQVPPQHPVMVVPALNTH